jgi:(E)-4-hydroxy-3-methylbut-2-enyl-diphosphate synthase
VESYDRIDVHKLKNIERKKTRSVRVGDLTIGGGSPVVVQEMTTTATTDIDKTLAQIRQLEQYGCRLIRVSVLDEESAGAIRELKKRVGIPIVGDVHFNYRLALKAMENGIDKLRINPGNIGSEKNLARVVSAAKERRIPIRVGVNSGSLQKDILDKYGGVSADALVESALHEVSLLEKHGFHDTVISIKAPSVELTVGSNRMLSSRVDYPLHIGITESGIGEEGKIRSIVGLGILLMDGIGDTVRISMTTSDRRENLRLCFKLLDALEIPRI